GAVPRDEGVGEPAVLGDIGAGAGDEDAELRHLGQGRPDLLSVDDVDVAVTEGPGAQVGEVRPGTRLAEELAPHLLAGEHRPDEALLLLIGAVDDEDGAAVTDPDRVER